MPKYKAEIQAIVTATVYDYEVDSHTEATYPISVEEA